jgi:diguanylate cyclase (GGDEF)-like protein
MIRFALAQLNKFFLALGKRRVFMFAGLLLLVLGWGDYVTGFEISFSFFYLIPISIVTWYIGIRSGYLLTLVGMLIWVFSNRLAGETYSSEWIRFFNTIVRLVVFMMIANLLHELRTILQTEHKIAHTDHLTGVFNSRKFHEQLALEIKRASRLRYPITLVYIDLDNFKSVNDQHGHSMGDFQLRNVAQVVSATIRKTDIFARLGGDEFALLLPNVDSEHCRRVYQKIESAVMKELAVLHSPITLSAGVITFKQVPDNVDDMIHQADGLMYEAKNSGKAKAVYFVVE